MLEIKDILEISKYREYEQGRELYGNRRVHNLNVMPFQDSGRYEVTADIKESDERNGKLYQIRLWIDEKSKEHKIYSYTCTCEKDGLEMCRHNVAAAFSFVKFRKSQELKKEVIPVTEQRLQGYTGGDSQIFRYSRYDTWPRSGIFGFKSYEQRNKWIYRPGPNRYNKEIYC